MNKRLVRNLSQEQKKEFEHLLRYNEVIRRVKELLEEDIKSCQTDRRSLKSLLAQNYSEYQADRNATERTLIKVLNILQADQA